MRAAASLGETRQSAIVEIVDADGLDNLLVPEFIATELKAANVRLGIVLDANASPTERWRRVRDRLHHAFPTIPNELPREGLVVSNDFGLRAGVWLMPNNASTGMLETFLAKLIPDPNDPLWTLAQDSANRAGELGAPFKRPAHDDKAFIHTWLAWQDPPGRQLHDAVKQQIFVPGSEVAEEFVRWFCELFEIEDVESCRSAAEA